MTAVISGHPTACIYIIYIYIYKLYIYIYIYHRSAYLFDLPANNSTAPLWKRAVLAQSFVRFFVWKQTLLEAFHYGCAMAEEIVQTLDTVAKFLAKFQGAALFTPLSHGQREEVARKISDLRVIDASTAIRLTEAIEKVPWATTDHDYLLEMIAHKSLGNTATTAHGSNGKPQDYQEVTVYIPEQVWKQLAEAPNVGMEELLDHLVKLGLRHPNEMTVQKITSLFLISSEGRAKSLQMNASMKNAILKSIKGKLRKKSAMNPALSYIAELPKSVVSFKEKWPEMYAGAFPVEGPGQCPYAAAEMLEIQQQIPMRQCKRNVAAQPMQLGTATDDMPPAMVQFGCQMLMQMKQMQENQMAMSRLLTQTPGSSALGAYSTRLAIDAPPPPKAQGSLLAIGDAGVAKQNDGNKAEDNDSHANADKGSDGELPPKKTPESKSVAPPKMRKRKSLQDITDTIISSLGRKKKPTDKTTKNDGNKSAAEKARPVYCPEPSRSQIQCRTGLKGPNQNTSFKYGTGKDSQKVALEKAKDYNIYKQICMGRSEEKKNIYICVFRHGSRRSARRSRWTCPTTCGSDGVCEFGGFCARMRARIRKRLRG